MKHDLSRRRFVKGAAAGLGFISLPALAVGHSGNSSGKARTLKIICFGGHPDDPESGCGGTLAKLAGQGHTVKILYLTRGEAGIPGKSHQEAASIRSREAEEACKILKVEPFFAGQIDGDSRLDNESLRKILQWMEAEQPDIVFTHWPVDTH
jgi:LmbE family N-acetylglucosaminyl deacetylase